MRYAYQQICLDPLKPVRQYGHSCQVDPVSEVHDHLHGRILAFEDENMLFVNVSVDLLGIDYVVTQKLEERLNSEHDKPVHLVISATHTHYGGDTRIEEYRQQCLEQIYEGISSLQFKEGQLSATYKSVEFEGVGTSRITGHKALVLLNLIQIYDGDEEVVDIINHNCHPTVLSAEKTHFFSSEYVGYALSRLHDLDGLDYTFLQGAAGDVSTRFTRKGQQYRDVEDLGEKLVEKVSWLKQQPAERKPLSLAYQQKMIEPTYDLTPIDVSLLPDNLSERELYTISLGKGARTELIAHPERWQRSLLISQLDLGLVRIIFAPNEFFSYYLSVLDTSKAFLVCYSNGYSPYVAPLDQLIYTYETFTDILSRDTKQEIVDTLKSFN